MNRFDELLQVTLDNAMREMEMAMIDHRDRERERCDTGRPHSPLGITGQLLGCKCRPRRELRGLQGFLEAAETPHAEVLWYGNISDVRARRTARIIDIDS